jgi:hypothetical protein
MNRLHEHVATIRLDWWVVTATIRVLLYLVTGSSGSKDSDQPEMEAASDVSNSQIDFEI